MDVLKSELDSLYSKTHTRTHNLYQLNTIKLKGDINYSLSLFKQSIVKYYSQLTIHKNHEQQLCIKISNILLIYGCYELQGKRYSRLYTLARSHDTFIAVLLDQLYKHLHNRYRKHFCKNFRTHNSSESPSVKEFYKWRHTAGSSVFTHLLRTLWSGHLRTSQLVSSLQCFPEMK